MTDTPENGQGPAAADAAAAASECLGPELGLVAGTDSLGFTRAWEAFLLDLIRRPEAVLGAAGRTIGSFGSGVLKPEAGDRRFSDPAWTANPFFFALQQGYLAWAGFARDLVHASQLEGRTKERAAYITDLWLDALSPTNFLWGNPTAQRRAVDTRGASLAAGLENFLHDVATNGGRPSQVDTSPFRLGENLAATPGKVVFRNRLMELIQYSPQTETVYKVPLLLSPPWINKYYIMDLSPGRSFAEWAVQQGHTVFAISYRNPDESMRDVALDDYLIHGPHTALDVITEITGAPKANIVGLCLGGTLTTMLLAYLAAGGEDRVGSATLLNTLIDFSEPGPLGWFLDRASVDRLDEQMLERGYLDSTEMSAMFDLLRPRDLIWNYVVSGWLMGEKPPAFDILAWNGDGTRMPAEMHSFYLRYCYGENQLARDEMTLAGRRLRLGAITADTYLLSAQEDHIAPWRSSYAATQLLGGKPRFAMSSSGHVAGIVNPPGPSRRKYWTNDALPADPEAWRAGAEEHSGSWWEDWAEWISTRSGERAAPPPTGSKTHPPIEDAPGTYVHEK